METTGWISPTGVLAVVSIVALIVAFLQLRFLHREAKSQKTREMIRRFSSDPMIIKAIDHISKTARKKEGSVDYSNLGDETGGSQKYVKRYLNVLEELSHGVIKKELDESDIKLEFETTVKATVHVLVIGKDFQGRKARTISDTRRKELERLYPRLMEVFHRWSC